MISLTDFDKKRIAGSVYMSAGAHDNAVEAFQEALVIKPDSYTYCNIARCYEELGDYEKAHEYALKAINSGFEFYGFYIKIAVHKLELIDEAIQILNIGVGKGHFSACLEMASLHITNNIYLDMINADKAIGYLDKAYECAPEKQKALAAYHISLRYRKMSEVFSKHSEDYKAKEYLYFRLFMDRGGATLPNQGAMIRLFDLGDTFDDWTVIDYMLKNFDGESCLIFGLLLIEEEYKKTKTIDLDGNLGFLCMYQAALRYKNGAAMALLALCFASDFKGVKYNPVEAKQLMEDSKKNGASVPQRFESLFWELMDHLEEGIKPNSGRATA